MKIDRSVLRELARFAAGDDEARSWPLRGVHVAGQVIEATDARMLARAPLELEPGEKPPPSDREAGTYEPPWALPRATGPREDGIAAKLSIRPGAKRLAVSNGRGDKAESARIKQKWPDSSHVEPTGKPVATVRVDPQRLCRAAAFMAAAAGVNAAGLPEAVTIEFYGGKGGVAAPVVFRADSGAAVYLMPMRERT